MGYCIAQNSGKEHFSKLNVIRLSHHLCTYNAPTNIMPHYPPPGLYRGKGGRFDFDLTPKLALCMGNLITHHMHVQKCEH